MARFPVTWDGRCLLPGSKAAHDALSGLKRDRYFIALPKKPRNQKAHAMYWALCQYTANAINAGPLALSEVDAERVSDRIKIATGHCEIVKLSKAQAGRWETPTAVLPRSISFAKMDGNAFSKFLTEAVQYIAIDLCPYLTEGPDQDKVAEILRASHVAWPGSEPHPDQRSNAA